ncbi:MAG: dienelactone hydrolase family protein [Altererythrobacter sp.]
MKALERIEYSDRAVALTGYLVRPATTPTAAIAVFPTIHNITPRVAEKAQMLADAGYLAMVMDFYGEEVSDADPGPPLAQRLRADTSVYRRRLHAGLAALRAQAPDLPMLAIGFCMGGQAVLELARDGANLLAVASFHGLLETQRPAEPGAVTARLLVCHGDRDPLVPRKQVRTFMEEMDHAGADWHLHIYAGAVHGFTDPANDESRRTLSPMTPAPTASWAAMLNLFDEVLPA